jgi:hypothetical protein
MRRMFQSMSHHLISSGDLLILGALSSVENRSLTDPAEIEQALRLGEYIKNGTRVLSHHSYFLFICIAWMAWQFIETLALYSLRKYRYLKQHYDSTVRDT